MPSVHATLWGAIISEALLYNTLVQNWLVAIEVLGITDTGGDPMTVTVVIIFQAEPIGTRGGGDGAFGPDEQDVGSTSAEGAPARRSNPGSGRVYHIPPEADEGAGGIWQATVPVGVPHDRGKQGTLVDNVALCDAPGRSSGHDWSRGAIVDAAALVRSVQI